MNNPEEFLAPYPFPGPDPIMDAPDKNAVIKAEISLTQALHPNNNGQHAVGISENDAHVLLQWIVNTTRMALITALSKNERTGTAEEKTERTIKKFKKAAGELATMCSPAQAISSYVAEHLGVEGIRQLHSYRFYDENRIGHDFAVMVIPVIQQDKSIRPTPYLIDVTYRQFFDPTNPNVKIGRAMHESIPNAGFMITKTREGRQLADTLLRNGYVELTEQQAELYLCSFAGGKKISGSYLDAILDPAKDYGYKYLLSALQNAKIDITSPLRKIRENGPSR
jgi:hypothetical protein